MERQRETDPRPEASTIDLVKEAMDESQELLKAEIALARHEALREILELKHVAMAFGAAAVIAILGLALLLVAVVLAITPHAYGAAIAGGILLLGAGAVGLYGYRAIPKKPVAQTQENLKADVRMLKERLA